MTLHLQTILFISTLVAALLGTIQLVVWAQRPRSSALLWWAAGFLMGSFGSLAMAFRPILPESVVVPWANAAILLAFSCIWSGTRAFSGRTRLWPSTVVAPLIWLATCCIPSFLDDLPSRVALFSLLVGAVTLAAARELGRPINRPLFMSRLAAGILYVHGVLLLVRIPSAYLLDYSLDYGRAPVWLSLYALEPLLFTIATGLCLIALVKERALLREQRIANADPLTGIANRRAFLDHAEDLATAMRRTSSAGAMLLFDLDYFKQINDRFGHQTGDRVLRRFAEVVTGNLRHSDAIGRIGGEEFAAFLPGADAGIARRNADRIRVLFSQTIAESEDHATEATVSIGIAVTWGAAISVPHLLDRADRALYRAKTEGRDRVVVDVLEDGAEPSGPAPSPGQAADAAGFLLKRDPGTPLALQP